MAGFDYGFVGLGAMGSGMAGAMADTGLRIAGVDPDPGARSRAESWGVTTGDDLAWLLEDCHSVVMSLPSESALDTVYREIEVTPSKGDQLVVETSTVSPARARDLAAISRTSGRRHIEAGLIGLPQDARAGALYHFVGGQDRDVAAAAEFLSRTGRAYAHLGDVGSAAVAKVLNNAIGNATMLAYSEAIAVGEILGMDPAVFVTAVKVADGSGMSKVFARHAHWATGGSKRQPPTPINRKDMAAYAAMAREAGSLSPVLGAASRVLAEMSDTDGLVQTHADQVRDSARTTERSWN
ncbi:NAD(P)-dependent oxidoreductase [Roseibium sp. MMSF_3544]|uniref:NAD(P)-dependent oxidoreductase n=1 Tax=unclassified Roseibium TaxID=2629323 RepID=UPI00273EC9ED|nr:NAD(P)-binding domain-containing protein [Roseibium sp. MMSF_3544]